MTRFIVIEGIDGTGKKTQFDLLVKYLRDDLKKPVLELDFPRYGTSGKYVGHYLNGDYGEYVAPELASILYAFDRWKAKPDIDQFIAKHPDGFIVSNRYTGSNLAHQGGKISGVKQRRDFYKEIMDLEFNQFGVPRPDLNFVLLLPEDAAQKNVDKKATRGYTNQKRDLHEKDSDHLHRAATAYRELVKLYPDDFVAIDCWDPVLGQMRTIEDIQGEIRERL